MTAIGTLCSVRIVWRRHESAEEKRMPSKHGTEGHTMAKYTERKTTGVQLSEIDAVDVAIVLRLLETKKLTKAQWVAVRRLLSAWMGTD